MILQALKEYYDRKAMDPESQMAPPGFEWKEVPFIIVLNRDGIPINLEVTYEGEGRSRRAHRYLVPQAVKRSVGIEANLFWDNPEYALGVILKDKKRSSQKNEQAIKQRVSEQHEQFKKRIDDLNVTNDSGLAALRRFLSKPDKAELLQKFETGWNELKKSGANLSFKLSGQNNLIFENPTIQFAIHSRRTEKRSDRKICLITGTQDAVKRLHNPIKGVWGAQTSGANIVSFNLDPFRSFNKKKGDNAPVGKAAADAYVKALNHLLDKDSTQRMQVGDASAVFWSAKENNFEKQMVSFFGEPPKDDPDRGIRAVRSLFKSVEIGAFLMEAGETRFYVLGLAPNASRIVVRFWIVDTVAGMAGKICQHFLDTRIVHGPKDQDSLSIFRLLVSIATQGKSENIPPNLSGDTMRAILEGLPYPQTLLQAAVRRIYAEREIIYPRAALIKACINRFARYQNPNIKEDLKVSLDRQNISTGYRLGRLFAALEKIQQEASPGINATIRDKFYSAASSTPVTVFGNLMRLKNHHLAKLEHAGRRVFFEKLLGEIIDGVEAKISFPSHLDLENQGRFAIGYYHQMQDFYTKKN